MGCPGLQPLQFLMTAIYLWWRATFARPPPQHLGYTTTPTPQAFSPSPLSILTDKLLISYITILAFIQIICYNI